MWYRVRYTPVSHCILSSYSCQHLRENWKGVHSLSNELAAEDLQRVLGTRQKATENSPKGNSRLGNGPREKEIGGYSGFDGFAGSPAQVQAAESLSGPRVQVGSPRKAPDSSLVLKVSID